MAAAAIAPPDGFVLDAPTAPPDGFVLDQQPQQPDMTAANHTFARTLVNSLSTVEEAHSGITQAVLGKMVAPFEMALNAGTGALFGFPAKVGASLGGLAGKYLLGQDSDPKELADTMQDVFTYTPKTEAGQRLTGNVMMPLDKLNEYGTKGGQAVTDFAMQHGASDNTAAAAGAITEQTLQFLPYVLLGELGRKMGGQTVTGDDMTNTAKIIAGKNAAPADVQSVESSLRSTYDQTGIGPFTVAKEAMKDPALRADLMDAKTDVPKAFQEFVEKQPEVAAPTPGDGAPLLDVSGNTIDETLDNALHSIRGVVHPDDVPTETLEKFGLDDTPEIRQHISDVARAAALDEVAVKQAALVHENDEPAFHKAIQEIINGKEQSETTGAGGTGTGKAESATTAGSDRTGSTADTGPGRGVEGTSAADSALTDAEQKLQNLAEGVKPGGDVVNKPPVVEGAALDHDNPWGNKVVNLNSGLNVAGAVKDFVGGYSPYLGVDKGKIVSGAPASTLLDSLAKVFAPAARGEIAERQAGIMRANFGEMAREREVALEKLKGIAAGFDKLPVADNIKFIDAMEHGTEIKDQKLAQAAQELRGLLDAKREEVQALGKGNLENFDENYFPHIWKQADEAQALFSRRPLEGSKSFLKQRTIPYTTDGLKWRAYDADGDFIKSYDTEAEAQAAVPKGGRVGQPLTPITTNPVELALLKAREMDKYIYGQKVFEEMKAAGMAKFVRFGERAQPGWMKIDDKIARVWSPADVNIHEAYDAQMMGKLQQFAKGIGVTITRGVKIGGAKGAGESRTWGWANKAGQVATKFGGPETVLTHELGHQLDYKYGLSDMFKTGTVNRELSKLADLRFEGQSAVPASFKSYVRKGSEKIANMVHAYVHMPERFQQVAPNSYLRFKEFIDEHPELHGLNDIKPSLTLGSNVATINAGGMILRGEYYAPDEAATLINNHLSPGLQGNAFFDAWRGIGAAMNSAQLGLSFFHVGFTTMDSMISKVALGMKQLARGDVLEGAGNVAQGMNPAQPFMNIYKGDKLLRAYLGKLDDPDMAPIVDALQQAGGRVKMDDFYRNEMVNAFKNAMRNGDKLGAAKSLLPTILDRISAPIFEELVPRQKLGVFFDMAKDWLEKNPKAGVEEKRAGLGKLWDSVDNRMGQLVYDNVFWDRALKDGLMATVRSVGWNLGTFRELGGGILDLKDVVRDKGISDRTGYVMALPLVASVYGSILGYAYTGQMPETLKDCFYPKTGRLRPDGSEDRVSLPTYMKDVFAYGEDSSNFAKYGSDPTQTLKNKANPLISTISQMLNNEDYFGAAIRNPSAPAVQQVEDEAKYLIKQIEPFSLRNYQQQAKAKGEEPSLSGYLTSPSMIGVTPAPGYITKTPEQQESAEVSHLRDPLMKKFGEDLRDGGDLQKLIPQMINAGLTRQDIRQVIKNSGETTRPHRLKQFGNADETEKE